MNKEELKNRTKRFALNVVRLVDELPKNRAGNTFGGQLIRSGTSVAANYRSACRARSTADFVAKMGVVEEEADETIFWMELLIEAHVVAEEELKALMKEADEILAIIVSSIKTARRR